MFEKVKFNLADGCTVSCLEGKDVSLDEVIRILKSPNLLSCTVTRATPAQYLKGVYREAEKFKSSVKKQENEK